MNGHECDYEFYHSEKLQSTKTSLRGTVEQQKFYHSEKLQSTKTVKHLCHLKI